MKANENFHRYGVTLKPLTVEMLDTVRQWRNDPQIAQHMLDQTFITLEMQQRWFEKLKHDDSRRYWVVWFKGDAIGVASLVSIQVDGSWAEPGMYIYPDQYRNNILPFCAAFALNDFAFEELKLKMLVGKIFMSNEASVRFHQRSGYIEIPPEEIINVPKVEELGLRYYVLTQDAYEAAKAPIARFIRYD